MVTRGRGFLSAVVGFLFEIGKFRLLQRTGWINIGVEAEHLSDHIARGSQLAYILAVMEGHPDPARVVTMFVFHENGETRCLDHDYLARRYCTRDERRAVKDQTKGLAVIGKSIRQMWIEVEKAQTPAGRIAKDADRLENALRARELEAQGVRDAGIWLSNLANLLRTESAKTLLAEILSADPNDWFRRIALQ